MQTPLVQAVFEEVSDSIAHLLRAYRFAEDVQLDPWEFALSLRHLVDLGIDESYLRWMTIKGYVEFADEYTTFRDAIRQFRPRPNLSFSNATCFVLTRAGLLAAQGERETEQDGMAIQFPKPSLGMAGSDSQVYPPANPHYDRKRRVLRLGNRLVKQFRRPAGNQESVLVAFQEEGWPDRIDDPLRPSSEQDPKVRLNFTVRRLNGCQTHRLIRFFGDGTGRGFCWEPLPAAIAQSGPDFKVRRAA